MAEVFVGLDITGDGVRDADITPAGSEVIIGGVRFTDSVNVGSGTGGYNTFLAIEDDNDPGSAEEGFNSEGEGENNYELKSFTNVVKLSELVVSVIDGVQYYEFRMDLNEANSDPDAQLSLDQFKLYTSTNGEIVDRSVLFGENLIYDMDAVGPGGTGGNVSVLLSDAESTGSGSDDYAVLVPISEFAGLDPTVTYVYLYSQMGAAGANWGATATFEEWNLQNGVTLTGTKFNDRDGDGVKDDGEGPVAGVVIYIDANKNNLYDEGERTTTTDIDGNYTFYGVAADQTVWIDEIVPTGSTQTTDPHEVVVIPRSPTPGSVIIVDPIGNFNPVDLSGTKYLDFNGDGQVTDDDGMGGVTIFIDMDNDGAFDPGELSTVTIENGSWSFTGLSSAVIGKKIYEILPSGYVQTIGAAGYTITGDQSGLVFANFERFDISGFKYTDRTGNGLSDDDIGLVGVTIFIDVNGNNINDDGFSAITGATGAWSITGLDYTVAGKEVKEITPTGYVQTVGQVGTVTDTSATYLITGTSGTDQSGLNFANFERFDISGFKYTDRTGNGLSDDDIGLVGVTIFIDVNGNNINDDGFSAITGATGAWSITGLDYTVAGKEVKEITPTGYVQTVGQVGTVTDTSATYLITGTSGTDQSGLNFANFERFDISGFKYTDRTGNGLSDDDIGLVGVTIFIDVNGNNINDDGFSAITGATGAWSITGLDYTVAGKEVKEITPTGYVQTVGQVGTVTDTSATYLITGTSGTDQSGLNFANFERFDISGFKYTDRTGNGLSDDDIGLVGVTIFIDVNGNNINDDGFSAITGATGAWSITGLDYTVAGKEVKEITPTGYVQTVGQVGTVTDTSATYLITGTSGTDQSGLNFANFERFDISGFKYTDRTGNGLSDDDIGLVGVTIFIDVNGNNINDDGFSAITGATGAWSITGLDYTVAGKEVKEITPTGYVQTVGQVGTVTDTSATYLITGTSGTDQSGLNFANFERFDISGFKYTDRTGNGLSDDDIGLVGVTIFIDVNGNNINDDGFSAITGATGAWSITGLDYTVAGKEVKEITPTGYVQTVGQVGTVTDTSATYLITGTSGTDQSGLNFANFERFDISGFKYLDANGDAMIDGDGGLGNVTIYIDVNDDGDYDAGIDEATLTAEDGSWSFDNLDYTYAGLQIREVVPSGYIQTVGIGGYTITGTSGSNQTGLVFANFLPAPSIELIKYVSVNSTDGTDGLFVDANLNLGPENINIGTDVWFKVTLDNTGNVALTGVDVEDINTTTDMPGTTFDLMVDGVLTLNAVTNYGATLAGDTNGNGDLDIDEVWTITYYQDFDAGNHINTAYVTTDQDASDNDLARYFSMINDGPGVRTPGFWQNMNNGGQFWDGKLNNEKNRGQDCFADGELLYAVDGDGDGTIDPFIDLNGDDVSDNAGLLIGDYNMDGYTGDNPFTDEIEGPEDTLFISLADARALINASNKQLNSLSGDGKFMLGRDMVATWLNYLAGNEIGGASDTKSPHHYLDDAIDWMQFYSGTGNVANETYDLFKLAGAPIKTNGDTWKLPQNGLDHSALQLHNALDYYNNTGKTEVGGTPYAHDCDDMDFYNAVQALSLI